MGYRTAFAVLAAALGAVVACPNSIVHGTALVVGVSSDGIVLGQDNLRAGSGEILKPQLRKFSICGPETVCGTSGLSEHDFSCSFRDSRGRVRGGNLKYNSYGWLAAIEKESSISGDASPKIIANAIRKKARTTFDPIECFYFHSKEGQAQIESDGPVMYVVAGYPKSSDKPEVYVVRVQYDRQNKRLLYPAPEKIFPKNCEDRSGLFVAGEQDRFKGLEERREPFISIFNNFHARRFARIQLIAKDAPLPLQETIAEVTAFIDLESEFNKNVGGGSFVAVIRRGKGFTTLYMPQIASK